MAIKEEDKVIQLLASLPETYNTLVTALEANTDVPTMEVVKERLLLEERKISERKTSEAGITNPNNKAMTALHGKHKKGRMLLLPQNWAYSKELRTQG